MRRMLLIGGLAFALLAYAVYEPMPEHVQDRAFLTFGHALFNVLDAAGKVAEFFSLTQSEVIRRSLFSILLPPVRNSSDVTFTYRQFADSRTLVASAANPSARSGAGLVYLHGGGWVIGSPEMYWELFAELVQKTGLTVFAVRYRLAPEHKFPAAFDDCLAAAEAIFASAEASGVDPSRIAVAGDSAGGQLAASVVQQLLRGGGRFRPKLQLLVFPVTQVANLHTESYRTQLNAPLLKPAHMHSFISLYLTGSKAAVPWIGRNGHVTEQVSSVYEKATGDSLPTGDRYSAPGGADLSRVAAMATDFRVTPLLGDDLEKLGLPPAHILACEFDPLFDDSVLYARRLERSGVRTHLKRFSTYHGATTMPRDGLLLRSYLISVFRDEL